MGGFVVRGGWWLFVLSLLLVLLLLLCLLLVLLMFVVVAVGFGVLDRHSEQGRAFTSLLSRLLWSLDLSL